VRVIITGGTGFIGKALAIDLLERGDDVVVLTRGKNQVAPCPRAHHEGGAGKVELATWTPEEPGDWSRIVDGADVVVHLAGAPVLDERWTDERMTMLRASRVRSTELLADAIAKAERKPRVFVSSSAIGYYGVKTGDRVCDEETAAGDDFLATLCRDWEAAAAPAKAAGVRVVHPRIGIVLGRGGGVLQKMVPMFKAFVGGPIGGGTQWVAWIHLADTLSAIEHMIANEDLAGPINVTAPTPVTMNELSRELASALHRPAPFRVPSAAIRLALGAGPAEVVLTGQRAIPKRLSASGFPFLFADLPSALADIVSQPARVVL
jgi:hypothetical protein